MVKRAFDIMVSSLSLLLLVPFFIILATLIRRNSPGQVFYRGERVGRRGKVFRIFKFRTMVVDAEQLGGSSTADDDPRITGIGRILRKYKIDELPQLINVFQGQMSLVGPRPDVPGYVAQHAAEYAKILEVKPGITDWASIWNADEGSFLADFDDPDAAFEVLVWPTKLKLQMKYCREMSFLTDLKILIYTVFRLFNKTWIPSEVKKQVT